MKIKRSYSVDQEVYKKFLEYVEKNSINISKFIENCFINEMKKEQEKNG